MTKKEMYAEVNSQLDTALYFLIQKKNAFHGTQWMNQAAKTLMNKMEENRVTKKYYDKMQMCHKELEKLNNKQGTH